LGGAGWIRGTTVVGQFLNSIDIRSDRIEGPWKGNVLG
jgi:hypothetical protein